MRKAFLFSALGWVLVFDLFLSLAKLSKSVKISLYLGYECIPACLPSCFSADFGLAVSYCPVRYLMFLMRLSYVTTSIFYLFSWTDQCV